MSNLSTRSQSDPWPFSVTALLRFVFSDRNLALDSFLGAEILALAKAVQRAMMMWIVSVDHSRCK